MSRSMLPLTRLIVSMALGLAANSTARAGSILYVDDDAQPRGDGQSWSTAFRYLQDALMRASGPRRGVSEIHVAQGSYRPDQDEVTPSGSGDQYDSFALIDGIALRGGYAGVTGTDPGEHDPNRFTSRLNGAVLEGSPLPVGLPPPPVGTAHIVTATGVGRSAVLEGFVISSQGIPRPGQPVDQSGRAMLLTNASPTIVDCRITENASIGRALAASDSSPLISHCVFDSNPAGAIFAQDSELIIDQCLFQNNVSGFGGSIRTVDCTLRISNSTFRSTAGDKTGTTTVHGGAISHLGGELILDNCLFDSLRARDGGGAISCSMDRITITDCVFQNNQIASDHILYTEGGALWIAQTRHVLIRNCQFTGNGGNQTLSGGAVNLYFQVTAAFEGCTFTDNSTLIDDTNANGGAIIGYESNITITASSFSGNQSFSGGAISLGESSSTLSGCTFMNNSAAYWGGAVVNYESAMAVSHSDFLGNTVLHAGGAIANYDDADLQVFSCRFIANRAVSPSVGDGAGGAVFGLFDVTCRTENCLFAGNSVSQAGGVAYFSSGSVADFGQCTLVSNAAGVQGGGIFVRYSGPEMPAPSHASILNCILQQNSDKLGMLEQSQLFVSGPAARALDVSHSCVQGWTGALGGVGNFGDDPQFIDLLGSDGEPGTGDENLRLSARSPAIDSGDNAPICGVIPSDLDEQPRITDGDRDGSFIVDMGAYEAPGPEIPAADLNCDGVINTLDLGTLLASWSIPATAPGCGGTLPCAADLNHDGVVNTLDLGILLTGWTL